MESGPSLAQPINTSSNQFDLFRKQADEVLFGVIEDVKGLEEMEEGQIEDVEVKRSELGEHLRTTCKLDVLKDLTKHISEYNRSRSASKYGVYVGVLSGIVVAASYAVAPYLVGKPPLDVLGLKIGYELVDKILKTTSITTLFGFLVYGKNKLDVRPYEQIVRDGMIGLFGEGSVDSEENFKKGMKVTEDIFYNIMEQAEIYGIPV